MSLQPLLKNASLSNKSINFFQKQTTLMYLASKTHYANHMLHIQSHYLSRHTAPRLKSNWVVFQPGTSSAAPSPRVSNSNLSVSASATAASASAGEILNRSCPRRPSVRWYVSFRQPAFEMTTLNSSGRMGLRVDKDSELPCGGLNVYISIFCFSWMWTRDKKIGSWTVLQSDIYWHNMIFSPCNANIINWNLAKKHVFYPSKCLWASRE